jgi:hypothetical protein
MSRNKPIPDPASILASGDPTGASEEGELPVVTATRAQMPAMPNPMERAVAISNLLRRGWLLQLLRHLLHTLASLQALTAHTNAKVLDPHSQQFSNAPRLSQAAAGAVWRIAVEHFWKLSHALVFEVAMQFFHPLFSSRSCGSRTTIHPEVGANEWAE